MHQAHALTELAVCGDGGGLILSLFVTGLISSLAHCSLMCGPLVLAQTIARLERIPAGPGGELRRLAGAALLPYQTGRLLTYAGLGAVAGATAGEMASLTLARMVGAGLLGLAALLLAGQALPRRARSFAATSRWERWISPWLAAPTGWRGLRLGLVLGLLPCGLLYAALAAAAASGTAWGGAMAMAAFGLGTVPALVAVAWLGQGMLSQFRSRLRRFAAPLLLLNAGWLAWMALQLVK